MSSGHLQMELASSWISVFGEALAQANVEALLGCLDPACWLRDIMVFFPSFETRHGHDAIRAHLQSSLSKGQISNVLLDNNPSGKPHASEHGPGNPIIATPFDFETPKAFGKGFARLKYPKDGETAKAFCVMMMINDWKGYEEVKNESGLYDAHNITWGEVRKQRRAEIERDPQAIIVGAGQTGLMIAARFHQMGIKALLIEKTARVGDVWRNRYPTLALHTPRSHHCFLYQPFPSNWPTFTPRDKLAYWMEQYASTQDLVVWTSSSLEPNPKYDTASKRWEVVINRNGVPIPLRPSHLVMATSYLGDPVFPSLPGASSFTGAIIHSGAFPGGEPFAGQNVIVLGAGNSSADVCQDLVFRGAKSVTMVQRSATAVVSDKYIAATFSQAFSEGRPTYYSDLAFAGLPIGALRELGKKVQPFAEEFDREMHEGLRKAGFKLTAGPDSSGQLLMVFDRLGGYFLDVGCASLISNGKVKVKQGVEIGHLTAKGAVFTDGSELEADTIILATGWQSARDKLISIFGKDMIDRTDEIWGSDEHGELRAGYKPSGQPGLWFGGGDFAIARFYSKFLALQIKGIDLGYFQS